MNMNNALLSKRIIEILNGDILLAEEYDIKFQMPYLSGPTICDIGTSFGFDMKYNWQRTCSRYEYMKQLLEYSITNKLFSKLMSYLFAKSQFSQFNINTLISSNIKLEDYVERVKNLAIDHINDILSLSNTKLETIGNEFIIIDISPINVSVDSVKTITIDYIKGIFDRTYFEIEQNNFDSAITKARTTMEEVFYYIIESENETPSDSGKLDDLYKQVKNLLNMNNNPSLDKRVNGLLSALSSIVNNIASMRNVASDSHGVGKSRITLEKHHTRLFVNSAMILCEFVLEAYRKKKS